MLFLNAAEMALATSLFDDAAVSISRSLRQFKSYSNTGKVNDAYTAHLTIP